jgi:RNA polymerase sigma-70 factor, ECF subfamily
MKGREEYLITMIKEIVEIIEKCREGDRAALARLVTLHKALISNVINRWVSDAAAAEDVLQNVFLCVIRSIRNFRFESDVSTWIYAIAQNECFRYLGRLKKERENVPLEDVEAVLVDRAEAGPERVTESLEIRERLNEIIKDLDTEKKTVITLYYYSGMDTAEIAQALNIPNNTVYTRLKRARDEIKKVLKQKGFEPF